MCKARRNHPGHRRHHARKQHPRQPRHLAQIAIEQRCHQQTRRRRRKIRIVQRGQRSNRRRLQPRPEPRQKARQPDAPRSNRQRRGKTQLPHVQKAQPVSRAVRPVDLAQKRIRPACARKRRSQFRPHQPVGHRDRRAQQPRPHREPVARRRNHQRQRDERPHADHLQHIEQHRRTQPDAPFKSAALAEMDVGGVIAAVHAHRIVH